MGAERRQDPVRLEVGGRAAPGVGEEVDADVKAVFLPQMKGFFDLDVAERAREVLTQFTIF